MKNRIALLAILASFVVTTSSTAFAMNASNEAYGDFAYIEITRAWSHAIYPSDAQALEQKFGPLRDEAINNYEKGNFRDSAENFTKFFRFAAPIATAANVFLAAEAFAKIGLVDIAAKYRALHVTVKQIDYYLK